jgi:hypothetical protein
MYLKSHQLLLQYISVSTDTILREPRPTVNSSQHIKWYKHVLTIRYNIVALPKDNRTTVHTIKVPQ